MESFDSWAINNPWGLLGGALRSGVCDTGMLRGRVEQRHLSGVQLGSRVVGVSIMAGLWLASLEFV